MRMMDLFEKVASYNEIAEVMGTEKVKVRFCSILAEHEYGGLYFERYWDFRQYVRAEYADEVAACILNRGGWKFNEDCTFETRSFGPRTFCADLVLQ